MIDPTPPSTTPLNTSPPEPPKSDVGPLLMNNWSNLLGGVAGIVLGVSDSGAMGMILGLGLGGLSGQIISPSGIINDLFGPPPMTPPSSPGGGN